MMNVSGRCFRASCQTSWPVRHGRDPRLRTHGWFAVKPQLRTARNAMAPAAPSSSVMVRLSTTDRVAISSTRKPQAAVTAVARTRRVRGGTGGRGGRAASSWDIRHHLLLVDVSAP